MNFETCFGELSTIIETDLPMSVHTEDEKSWGALVTSSSFLPRVQLFQGTSNLAKEGKIGPGCYGILSKKEEITHDLGKQFECLPLSYRYKAIEMKDGQVISVYNPKLPEFLRIQAASDTPDSGCMFGIEFLLWVPSVKLFVTFFLATKTARRQAPNLRNQLKQGTILKSEYIKKPKFSWHGPIVTQCSTPFEMPDDDAMLDEATKFANPKESEIEAVTPQVEGDRPQ